MKNNKVYYEMIKKVNPKIKTLIFFIILLLFIASVKYVLAMTYEFILNSIPDIEHEKFFVFVTIAFISIIISGLAMRTLAIKKRLMKQNTIYKLQKELLEKKQYQSLEDWEKQSKGEYITNLTSDCNTLASFFFDTQINLISGSVEFILGIVYGFSRSVNLTLIILSLSFFSVFIPKLVAPLVEKRHNEKQVSDGKIKSIVLETIDRLPVIKAFNIKGFILRRFEKNYDEYTESSVNGVKAEAMMDSLSMGIGFLANTIWMIAGIFMVISGKITIGIYVGFMTLCNNFNWPFFELSNIISSFAREKVSYERLYYKEYEKETLGEKVNYDNSEEFVVAKNINFKYSNDTKLVINNESYNFEKDTITSICGSSGNGKTTLLKILMGLYEVHSGQVYINYNNKKYTGKSIREIVSYVPQGNSLFSGTIRENIAYGSLEVSFEDIKKAAEIACADEFIQLLPKGYDTVIGTGSEVQLSEGQAQRIALARGLVKKSEVYFLDEVTSALDEVTAKKVLNNIKDMSKTIIMVAHRENAINAAKRKVIKD